MATHQTRNAHGNTLSLNNPANLETARQQGLQFQFPISGSTIFREGNDLGFTTAKGNSFLIKDFFSIEAPFPTFTFSDSPLVSFELLMQRVGIPADSTDTAWKGLYTVPVSAPPHDAISRKSGGVGE